MRARPLLRASAILVTLLGSLIANLAAAESTALIESGREAFQRYCASCHGVEAQGDGPVAATLKKPPPDLTLIASRRGGKFKSLDVASYIDGRFEVTAHGERLMPVWGRILGEPISESTTADEVSRGRIEALVSYLHSIQR